MQKQGAYGFVILGGIINNRGKVVFEVAVLVTGGAGYIGSHTVAELVEKKEEVIVVDNLEKGHRDAVAGAKLIVGDLRDKEFVKKVFLENDIEAVIHFAAYIEVGESVQNPLKYYNNNVIATLNLLTAMEEAKSTKLYFLPRRQPMVSRKTYRSWRLTEPFPPIRTVKPSWLLKRLLSGVTELMVLNTLP